MKNIDEMYQLERFSKTQEEFNAFYESDLKEKVELLEKDRQKTIHAAKSKAKQLIIPGIALVVIYFFFPEISMYAFLALILIGFFIYKDVPNQKRQLTARMKDQIVRELVHFLNENFTYEPNKFVSRSEFSRSNIFKNSPDRYKGDDLIKGHVGSNPDDVKDFDARPTKTDLIFSEVNAEKVERYKDKDGKTRERIHTIFKGLFFKADFNKHFEGTTIVVPKQRRKINLNAFFKSDERQKLEEVELENVDFMSKFTVRSTDQIKSRYILTPNFMNRLLEFTEKKEFNIPKENQPKSIKQALQMGLSQANNGNQHFEETPYFSFKDGKMYFMKPTNRNHFEFSIFLPLNKQLMESYFHDLNLSLRLVDELNLNLRIWTKE